MTYSIDAQTLNALTDQELRGLYATLKAELDAGIIDPDERAKLQVVLQIICRILGQRQQPKMPRL